jgi:small-conductance mechanosensitive channel
MNVVYVSSFVVLGILFMLVYIFTDQIWSVCASVALLTKFTCDVLFQTLSLLIQKTKLIEFDAVYLATTAHERLSYVASGIIFVVSSMNWSPSDVVFKLSLIWLIAAIILLVERMVLFYFTYNSLWTAYLPRIKHTVLAHEIVAAFKEFVHRYAPLRESFNRVSVSEFQIPGEKPFRKIKSEIPLKSDMKTMERTKSISAYLRKNTLISDDVEKDKKFILADSVSLHSVQNALKMTDMDKDEVFDNVDVIYDAVVQALKEKNKQDISSISPIKRIFVKTPSRKDGPGRWSVPELARDRNSDGCINMKDLKNIFLDDRIEDLVIKLLNRDGDKKIYKSDFVLIFDQIKNQRSALRRTLQDYDDIISVMDSALLAVGTIVLIFAVLLILNFKIIKNGVFIISLFVALSIAFGSTLQRFFEGVIFIFSIRPYDVGDRVFVRDETMQEQNLVVDKIYLMTTIFRRADGQYLTWSNTKLRDSVIVNAYRSEQTEHKYIVKVPCDVRSSFPDELNEFISKERLKYVVNVECFFENVRRDGMFSTVVVYVKQKESYQDPNTRKAVIASINKVIHEFCNLEKIKPSFNFNIVQEETEIC